MTKYVSNAMLATKISFMNEVANLSTTSASMSRTCAWDWFRQPYRLFLHLPGLRLWRFLFPQGCGALIHTAAENAYQPLLLQAVHQRNEAQKQVLLPRSSPASAGSLRADLRRVGAGVQAWTDDLREAPSLVLLEALLGAGRGFWPMIPRPWTQPAASCRRFGSRAAD